MRDGDEMGWRCESSWLDARSGGRRGGFLLQLHHLREALDERGVVEAAWDNSTLNLNNPDPTKAVGWGDQTFNEMFFASYRYTYPDAKPPTVQKTAAATPRSQP